MLLIATLCLNYNLQAQCSGCTTTISNNNTANQAVSSGQTLCITPTGTVSGQITILAGGMVCNQGAITSNGVWVAGGALANYGTIHSANIYVSSAGTFTNYTSMNVDSFLIGNVNATYYNYGTQINKGFAVTDHGTAINTGTITTNIMYDSIGVFTNNGNMTITDGLGNVYNSNFINNGNISITHDLANGYSSDFINNKNLVISRSFYNGNNANFTTHCMVTVSQDWYNSANVYGPVTGCGGFNITGGSLNSGTLGSAGTHIDICDAGHPTGGMDGVAGTVSGTTTYCNCANSCITVGVREIALSPDISLFSLYPNPAAAYVMVTYTTEHASTMTATIKDMMGRTLISKLIESAAGMNDVQLNINGLSEGIYILSVTDRKDRSVTKLFTIVK